MKRQEIFYATDLPHEEILQTMIDFDLLEERQRLLIERERIIEDLKQSAIILGNAFNSSNETLKQLGHTLQIVCINDLRTLEPLYFPGVPITPDHFYQPVALDSDGYYHEDSDFTSYIPKHGVYCSFIHQHKKEKPILLSGGFKTVFFHRKCFMQLKTFSNLRF